MSIEISLSHLNRSLCVYVRLYVNTYVCVFYELVVILMKERGAKSLSVTVALKELCTP